MPIDPSPIVGAMPDVPVRGEDFATFQPEASAWVKSLTQMRTDLNLFGAHFVLWQQALENYKSLSGAAKTSAESSESAAGLSAVAAASEVTRSSDAADQSEAYESDARDASILSASNAGIPSLTDNALNILKVQQDELAVELGQPDQAITGDISRAPDGVLNIPDWLPCDGSLFDGNTYPNLAAVLESTTLPNIPAIASGDIDYYIKTSGGGEFWAPNLLFLNGDVGVWYDPSDLSTLFQDSAGTTPVTDVEQPVGLMLDKSGGGHNATQSTAAARPVLSSRYNLLEKTEQFDDAYWFNTDTTVTANATPSPNGDSSADRIQHSTLNGLIKSVNSVTVSGEIQATIHVKEDVGSGFLRFIVVDDPSNPINAIGCWFNTSTGVFTQESTAGSGIISATDSESIGNGWWRVKLTGSLGVPAAGFFNYITNTSGTALRSTTVAQYWWGASLTEAQYSNLPYQRVNTSTDYDSDFTKFPPYVQYDQIDDQMVVTMPAIAAATVVEATDDGVSFTYPANIPAGAYVLENTSTLGRDYGRVIIDRALTPAEELRLQTYFDIKRGAA